MTSDRLLAQAPALANDYASDRATEFVFADMLNFLVPAFLVIRKNETL